MKSDDQLVSATVEQFRQISGLGTTKIWELIRDGTLGTVTFGKRRLIVVDSYRRALARQRAAPGDARRNRSGAIPSLGSKRGGPPARRCSIEKCRPGWVPEPARDVLGQRLEKRR